MKKLKGFTLVELIIVIVIIGILSAVTIVGYASQAKTARNNSVFSSLSESVKGANVCIANGDKLTTTPWTVLTIAGKDICVSSVAGVTVPVSGKWPDLTKIGGSWKYVNYSTATGGWPTTAPTTPIINSITAGALTIATGAQTGGSATASSFTGTDPGVSCTINGCTKYGF